MANRATGSKKAFCGKSAKAAESRKPESDTKSRSVTRRSAFEDEVRHLLLAPVLYYGGLSEPDMVDSEDMGRIQYH